jgi:hypothetical protein
MSKQLSFFPEPEFFPILPPCGSAAEQALIDLLERDWTTPEWDDAGNGWRLAAAVKALDYLGWKPISIPVPYPGRKRRIARYSLSQKAKQAAASMRQQRSAHGQ